MLRTYKKNGLENYDIYDLINRNGWYQVEIHIPVEKWNKIKNNDEEITELINNYTFPDYCIIESYYEILQEKSDSVETVILATIRPDLS